ncbi:MAG: trypsin-like serine peptidase [Aquabacterium sp.]
MPRRPPRPRAVSTGLASAPYMAQTNNGGRMERVAGFDVGRVMAQGFGGRRLPAALSSQRLGSATWLEYAFPQSVVGHDDRVPIVDTTTLPWRCICHLVVDGLHDEQVLGTGWMAGPRAVLTAGHNLFSHKRGRSAERVTVVPGRQLDMAPFGFFRSMRFDVHPRWRTLGDEAFDLGVIWLDAAVGDHVGWFGYGSRPDDALRNLIVNTAGYPADKRLGTQWFNAGRLDVIEPRILQYGLDTEPGQSGSPIFAVNAQDERVVLAVHAYGGDGDNRGIRITDDVFAQFKAWVG